jgi:beta-xylosidase
LRLPSGKVNGHLRNPVVLPTFLPVIPRGCVGRPQLFPNDGDAGPDVSKNQRRTARIVGIVCLVAGVPLIVLGLVLPSSGHAGARQSIGRVDTAYYEPPALTNPAHPGIVIASGRDLPDPFILVDHSRFYLFTSASGLPQNVPVRSGTELGKWGPITDALPKWPRWAGHGLEWAPDVHQFGDHYVMYFTAVTKPTDGSTNPPLCIGDAWSTKPAGPYTAAQTPIICQISAGGSIDPRTFVDADGRTYMIWKSDNNSRPDNGVTHIYSQRLSADGLHLVGKPTAIFQPDEQWQGPIVEAPQLVLVRGTYWLFYSGDDFWTANYAIGVARCTGPLGPCVDTRSTPLLASNAQGQGPGEESLFSDSTGIYMVYEPFYYIKGGGFQPLLPRPVEMAHIGFGPKGPYLASP